MQETPFSEFKAFECSSTQWTLNSYDNVNLVFFGYDVQQKNQLENLFSFRKCDIKCTFIKVGLTNRNSVVKKNFTVLTSFIVNRRDIFSH